LEIKPILSKLKLFDKLLQFILNLILRFVRIIYADNRGDKNKLLVISLHKIGDSVFTIPAIKAIINSFDYEQIFLIVYSETKIIFKDLFKEQNIITLGKKDFLFENRIATSKARKILKSINPETLIDLTGSITSASLIIKSRASRIIGMNEKYFKSIYSDFTEKRSKPHLIDGYCDIAELFLKKKIDRKFFKYPINLKKDGVILVQPFAGWEAKEWGLKKYITLTERLMKNFNTSLIFQKGEIKTEIIDYLLKNDIKFIQTDSLEELIFEIKKCSLFIGNDSGPLYLANYFGKPTFTIYGPTNPDYSKPFGNFHQQIKNTLKCSPIETQYCYLEAGRKCPSNECMFLLKVDSVEKEILEYILILKIITNKIVNKSEVKN
jgi:ADP-heptose:LPS heptosyltransferase